MRPRWEPGPGGSLGHLRLGNRIGAAAVMPGERPPMQLGESLRLDALRAWRGHEDRGSVVAQLLDALEDVGQGAMVAALGRCGEVRTREPTPGQLLDRGDVH